LFINQNMSQEKCFLNSSLGLFKVNVCLRQLV
jgi:hypothetical protein